MRHALDYIKKNTWLLFILIPAFICQMLVVMPSGSYYCFDQKCGLYFWGASGHDGLWHLEVSSISFLSYPFRVPTYAGELLAGYNILLDIIIFFLSKIGISPLFSYFKFLPVVWFFLMTFSSIWFIRKIKDSTLFVGIFLFFVFFGSSFGYLLTFYHTYTFHGSAIILNQQANQTLVNLQFAFSLPLLIFVLGIIKDRKFTIREAVMLGICTFLSLGLKFYAGVIALFLIGLYLLEFWYIKKSFVEVLKAGIIILLCTVLSILIFYNPFHSLRSGSIFVFAPFSIVHSIIEEKNLFYLKDMVNARYFLETHGMGRKLFAIELLTTFIYILFNLGTRFFGIIYFFFKVAKKTVTRFEIYIVLTIVFASLMAILFIQKGIWWNTVQFFYYSIFLSNIFIAELVYVLLKQKKLFLSFLVVLILLANIPENVDLLDNLPTPSYLSQSELQALEFLRTQPVGIVFNSFSRHGARRYDFFEYRDTGYISAFTKNQTYLGHFHPLSLMGIDYAQRLKRVEQFDCSVFDEVDYIYYVKNLKNDYLVRCNVVLLDQKFIKIFSNKEVSIYKIKK